MMTNMTMKVFLAVVLALASAAHAATPVGYAGRIIGRIISKADAGKKQEATGDVPAAQGTGVQDNPWLVAYENASKSAKKRSWNDENLSMEVKTFALGAPFGARVAGAIVIGSYYPPIKIDGQTVGHTVIYYALDCKAKTLSMLQNVRILGKNIIYMDQVEGRPQFFVPPNEATKMIVDDYCSFVYGQ